MNIDAVHSQLEALRNRQPTADTIHVLACVAHCALVPFSPAGKDVTLGLLGLIALARLPWTWRLGLTLLRMPTIIALGAFIAFTALSLVWSGDAAQGWDDLQAMRMVLFPIAAWPVLRHLPLYITATLLGVFMQNLAQLGDVLGILGLEPDGSRIDGTLHSIQTGSWCGAAVTLHVAGLLLVKRRGVAILLALGGLAAGIGLIATGSRGPWLATAIATAALLAIGLLRGGSTRRRAAVISGAGLASLAIAWPLVGSTVVERARDALAERRAAIAANDFGTSVGLRTAQARWALDLARSEPIRGTGAGSFEVEVAALPGFIEAINDHPEHEEYLTRAHPHSSYLLILSTTGGIGLGLFGLFLLSLLRDSIIDIRHGAAHIFMLAPPFLLVGWCVAAAFESAHLNGHHVGLLAFVMACCMPGRLPEKMPQT